MSTATKKIFVNEDIFKKLKPKLQRDFTDFILDTGCDYFPHSRETAKAVYHKIDDTGGMTTEEVKAHVNDWWELRLDELDATMMQIKYPDVFVIRKMDDYENSKDDLPSLDEMLQEKIAQGVPEKDFVLSRTDWEFLNERPMSDMLKTYVTDERLYDLVEKESESLIVNKLKK